MKIGFDVSQTAEDMAGCAFFAKQIISHLLDVDTSNEYLLYPVFYNYRHPEYKKAYQSDRPNAKNYFHEVSWAKLNQLWDSSEFQRDELLGHPDIIHSNNFCCPIDVRAKKIVTIYDMVYLDRPEFSTEANRIVCFNGAFESSIYADHIVTISESSKQSFLKYFPHYPEERISVIYLGSRPTLTSHLSESVKKKVIQKFNIQDSGFWLGVGTVEPRKNYRLLLEAYAKIVREYSETRPLFIAGGKGWLENDIQARVQELGIQDKVNFLGYVSDEELSVLYNLCFAFVYPSHYEGFGLPVLEAMSFGAPVITSNVTSIPEVIGDAGILMDPNSSDSLTKAMITMVQQQDQRKKMAEKSIEQAGKFSWERAARQTLDVYKKVMEQEPWHRSK
ncbi:glycosyltransferase family 4 protein [Paenibacillus antri]|nr:glycosyltransferase family 1 protein [Paenibacillus antri]